MDTKYKQIITSLNTNYTKSPNIITLWQVYLQIKKQRFMDDLCKCEQMLQQINNINNITFEENKPYSSEQQLMMILPPEYYKLLQEHNQHFMIDPESELIEFYPNEFVLEKMDKIREWMYEPILPSIDEKLILKYV